MDVSIIYFQSLETFDSVSDEQLEFFHRKGKEPEEDLIFILTYLSVLIIIQFAFLFNSYLLNVWGSIRKRKWKRKCTWRRMRMVPMKHVAEKIRRNRRSSTIATYFQSSSI